MNRGVLTMTDFLRNGIKEAFVSARLSKERVGKGSLLTYLISAGLLFFMGQDRVIM